MVWVCIELAETNSDLLPRAKAGGRFVIMFNVNKLSKWINDRPHADLERVATHVITTTSFNFAVVIQYLQYG